MRGHITALTQHITRRGTPQPLSAVFTALRTHSRQSHQPLLSWLLPNTRAVNLWAGEIRGRVRTGTPLTHSHLEEEKPFLHRSASFKEQAALKLGVEAQRRADVLVRPPGSLTDQDEGTMTHLTTSVGSREAWSRNRKGAMRDKASGKSDVNSTERAQRTRLQGKLLLGAETCCVRVGSRWPRSERGRPMAAGTQSQVDHERGGDAEAGIPSLCISETTFRKTALFDFKN